jgi:putative ATPase
MNLFSDDTKRPLADRVRPHTLDEFIGQTQVVGEGQFLRTIITQGTPTSLILWGPPGTGKTTLARIIASSGDFAFEEISAVTSGIADVKKVIERATERKKLGQATVLFVDEIHRFNKAQQDAFLPHVENGTIILIGATTENPSFEVIGPLLSRSRVVVLESLSADQILAIIERGVKELGTKTLDPDAARLLADLSAGDARVALGGLETAASLAGSRITLEVVKQAMQKPGLKYDKTGEYHYNLISAYIKSMRGGATDAAIPSLLLAAWSSSPPRTSAWPTTPPCRSRWPLSRRSSALACPRAVSRCPKPLLPCPLLPRTAAPMTPLAGPLPPPKPTPRPRYHYICATLPPSS